MTGKTILWVALAAIGLGFVACSTGLGAVTETGDISDGGTNTSTIYVGYSGDGTLGIDAGSSFTRYYGYLGYNSGCSGTATITGAGSRWTSSGGLIVGNSGSGTLNVQVGGQVNCQYASLGGRLGSTGTATVTGTGSIWTNNYDLNVGYSGIGTLNIEAGGQVNNTYAAYSGYLGYNSSSIGMVTVTGVGSKWNTNFCNLYVGYSGSGTLNVDAGGQVSNGGGYLGWNSGSTGTATVTGAGSKWANGPMFIIGWYGNGTLNVEAGGQVSGSEGYLGYKSGSTGTATVTDAGSTWTNSGTLYVGNSGSGTLTVADGGKVTATSVSVNSTSAVRLNVSGNGMLVLGNATTAGSVTNNGTISLYANAFLATGTYTPISAYPGKTITWSGSGSYNAVGGVWSSSAKTFTVADPVALAAGAPYAVSTGQRLLITDAASGKHVGASFGSVTAGTTFSASPMSTSELSALSATPGFAGSVLSGWDFSTNYTGGEVLLSFDIGTGAQNPAVWHYANSLWTPYTADDMLTYDAKGVASFTVTGFSGGYAVAGVRIPAMPLAGDANGDGKIGPDDLALVGLDWDPSGKTHTWAEGDFDGDGAIGPADLAFIGLNWAPAGYNTTGDAAPAVPEPATMALLALGGLAMLRRRTPPRQTTP